MRGTVKDLKLQVKGPKPQPVSTRSVSVSTIRQDGPLQINLRNIIDNRKLLADKEQLEKKAHGLQKQTDQLKEDVAKQKKQIKELRGELAIYKQEFRTLGKRSVPTDV